MISFIQVQLNCQVRDCVCRVCRGDNYKEETEGNRHDEETVLHVTTMFIENYCDDTTQNYAYTPHQCRHA